MNIAICDDEKKINQTLKESIESYGKEVPLKITIKTYTCGECLYEDLLNGVPFDLVFLDIQLYRINGIEIGHLIRNHLNNHFLQIVFISSQSEYALDLFAVHPLDFILKPIDNQQVIKCIEKTAEINNSNMAYFNYTSTTTTRRIPLSHILYFESKNRKIIIHKTTGEDSFYGKLSEIEEQLKDKGFLLIHKSYFINYLHIETCRFEYITMDNGVTLKISRSKQKEAAEKLLYLNRYGVEKA